MLWVRIASALVGLLILFCVLFFGANSLYVAVWIIATIGLYEFYKAIENKGFKPFWLVGILWTFVMFFMMENGFADNFLSEKMKYKVFGLVFFITFVAMLAILVINYKRYSFIDIALSIFGVMYVAYMFTFLPAVRFLPQGQYFVNVVFIGAWVTDTGGYFAGRFLGKRKIVPQISPKKTVAGSIGGIIACVTLTSLYGYILISQGKVTTELYHFIILGLICSVVSQLGDWIASVIKRYTEVKDFGNIMPGHGGVLDRFDSIIFMAPFVYYYIVLFINRITF